MGYDREAAVEYARRWAYGRNPRYGAFDELGGDCANFVSQCLFAGCGVMNPRRDTGWFYRSMNDRSPAWSSVFFLHRFLTGNVGPGPYGRVTPIDDAAIGDVVQLAFVPDVFSHACVVVRVGDAGDLSRLLISAHTRDSDLRPLDTYEYVALRLIHIQGARR